ncbi:MAG TPA: hypothetical protein VJ873_01690, partial [bacterium]|nr:hypothetical protein [bacterium]
NGSNQVEFPQAGAAQGGYWFDYIDPAEAANLCPSGSGPFFLSSPGNANVVPGVPSFCASIYSSALGGYAGMGFSFKNSGNMDISGGGQWSHLVFYVKSAQASNYIVTLNDSTTNGDGCYGPSVNFYPYNTSYGSATATTSWAPVTISFISTNGDYNLGLPTIISGTNGCSSTKNGGNPYAYDYTTAYQIQWQPQGSSATPFDLEVGDIYLY